MRFKQFYEMWFSPDKGPPMFSKGPKDGQPGADKGYAGKPKKGGIGGGSMPMGGGAAPQMPMMKKT